MNEIIYYRISQVKITTLLYVAIEYGFYFHTCHILKYKSYNICDVFFSFSMDHVIMRRTVHLMTSHKVRKIIKFSLNRNRRTSWVIVIFSLNLDNLYHAMHLV